MNGRIGEWMVVEGLMSFRDVMAVLEFQKHGEWKKFGQIALKRGMISGRDLRNWEMNH